VATSGCTNTVRIVAATVCPAVLATRARVWRTKGTRPRCQLAPPSTARVAAFSPGGHHGSPWARRPAPKHPGSARAPSRTPHPRSAAHPPRHRALPAGPHPNGSHHRLRDDPSTLAHCDEGRGQPDICLSVRWEVSAAWVADPTLVWLQARVPPCRPRAGFLCLT
jgi:hypothetical protein